MNTTQTEKAPEKITILMACRDQKEEFLKAAVDSVLNQTSPDWVLLIIVDVNSPHIVESVKKISCDPRIKTIASETGTLADSLNIGMQNSTTEFVCILHSDDILDRRAVETLRNYIQRYPMVDFFHSSRRFIDAKGRIKTGLMPSTESFTLDYFKKRGSPVKHLLCWRREKGIEIGGMDEDLTLHGCDDYDFPWRMAEAGSVFKAIKECLYFYRVHHDFFRLTTEVPLERQIEVIKKIFEKHKVSNKEAQDYIQKARKNYLIKDKTIDYGGEEINIIAFPHFRNFTEERRNEFFERGYKKRDFFPHKIYALQKGGPDGLKMAQRMCGVDDPRKLWELVLYATRPQVDEFPENLFFDEEIFWHQQHFGRRGQIATANLAVKGDGVFGMNYLSDIVQRIVQRREHKTRIENRFKSWHHLLLNGIMNFAIENNMKTFNSPSADLVMANADPNRAVKREVFERMYDRSVQEHFLVEKKGGWWRIDVNKNKSRVIAAEKTEEIIEFGKTICICHEIEGGWSHSDSDPDFTVSADSTSLRLLEEMMSAENELDIKATYCVPGVLFNEMREDIEKRGFCLAFYSYDNKHEDQLIQCRNVDSRIKGYRSPHSKISSELSEKKLSRYNFEWLASSSLSLGLRAPKIQKGIVKIPILFDDFGLQAKKIRYEEWEKKAIDMIKQNYFVAFSLHDSSADHWLPHYRGFLKKIRGTGEFRTLNEVANAVFIGSAQ